jgi:hypothetical protein
VLVEIQPGKEKEFCDEVLSKGLLLDSRVERMDLPKIETLVNYEEIRRKLLPKDREEKTIWRKPQGFGFFDLGDLFRLTKGKGDYLINLEEGKTPLISATGENNGVIAYVDLEPIFKAPLITVERISGNAFTQFHDFVTVPDDIIVLKPLNEATPEFLVYTCALIQEKKWKYCYGRKLSKSRLGKIRLHLPIKRDGNVDHPYINELVSNCYGWEQIVNYSVKKT